MLALWSPANLAKVAAGVALCALIAALATAAHLAGWLTIAGVGLPPLILALIVGMAMRPVALQPVFAPGADFAARTVLRIGVALLGARLTVGQLVEAGPLPVLVAALSVAGTICFGAWAARWFGLSRDFGLLTGCSSGVCGAAAAAAASAVLPRHENSARDLAFTVMGVNFLSTVVMLAYPPMQAWLGFSGFEMGVFLGGAIHDVAQVAGAGQSMGPQVLGDAVITKLLRVAFLLPAIIGIAWLVARSGAQAGDARPAPPFFLFGFLALAGINSLGVIPPDAQKFLALASQFLIVTAIVALGMKTSLTALARIGLPPVLLLVAQTVFVGVLAIAVIYAWRLV